MLHGKRQPGVATAAKMFNQHGAQEGVDSPVIGVPAFPVETSLALRVVSPPPRALS